MSLISNTEIYHKFPDNFTMEEMCDILDRVGAKCAYDNWIPHNHSKRELKDTIAKYKNDIADLFEIDFESVPYEKTDEEIPQVSKYQARYIGPRSSISHGSTSTFTGRDYVFPRMTWMDVAELDWNRIYRANVENAVNVDAEILWQVRTMNPQGIARNFFSEAVKKIKLGRKPKRLADVRHMNEDYLIILREYEIMSILEFLRTPYKRIQEILHIDPIKTAEMMDDAKRVLK